MGGKMCSLTSQNQKREPGEKVTAGSSLALEGCLGWAPCLAQRAPGLTLLPSPSLQTVKGGFSETRIEKRIIITGDEDVDQDQVWGWGTLFLVALPIPQSLPYGVTYELVCRGDVHFMLPLFREDTLMEGMLNGGQKEPEDPNSGL